MPALGMQYETATSTSDPIFNWPDYFPQYQVTTGDVTKASGQAAKAKISGVVQFSDWLASAFPDLYAAVQQSRPDIFMPELAMAGLAGLSNATSDAAAHVEHDSKP